MKQKLKAKFIFFPFIIIFFISAKYISFSDIAKSISGKTPEKIVEFLLLFKGVFAEAKYDKNAEEFHDFLSKSFENFDFKSLYNSKYMEKEGENKRWLTYSAKFDKNKFHVSLINIPFSNIVNPDFGDASTYFSLSKNPISSFTSKTYSKTPSYSLNLKIDSNFGNISHETGITLLDGLTNLIDSKNISSMEEGDFKIFKRLKKKEEKKIIYNFHKDFPSFSRFLNSYTTSSSLLFVNKEEITSVNFSGELNKKNISIHYPSLGEFLSGLEDLGWIKIDLILPSGKTLLKLGLDSKKLQLTGKLFSKSGKIIPFSSEDNLDINSSISLASLKKLDYTLKVSFHGNIFGLSFDSNGIYLKTNFSKSQTEGKLEFSLSKFDKIKVGGGFSYIIPVWLIDFVIPGNLEELANHFLYVIQNANKKGTSGFLGWKKDKNNWMFSSGLDTEIIDNFFIRFGLKIWNNKFLPSDDARKDIGKLIGRGVDKLIQDYPK